MTWLKNISDRLSGIKSLSTEIKEPAGLDNRSALMTVTWDPGVLNISSEEVAEDLAKNKPRIALGCRSDPDKGMTSLSLSAWTMKPGEDKIVAERLFKILNANHPEKSKTDEQPSSVLTGHWNVTVDYYTGKNVHRLFIENQDGNWLHGSYLSTFSLQDIYGKIVGNNVKMLSIHNTPGDQIQFTFSGTVNDNIISGTLYFGEYLTAKFSAKRSEYQNRHIPVTEPNYGRRNGNAW